MTAFAEKPADDGYRMDGGRMRYVFRVESTVTYRCNAVCDFCNKAVGLASFRDGDMTVEQMKRAARQANEQDVRAKWFTISGGEPIVHGDLQELVNAAAKFNGIKTGRVLTNDLTRTAEQRAAIKLPKPFRWIPAPLDDPKSPKSGKNDREKRKHWHFPFWLSPADMGLKSSFHTCTSRKWCGKGLTANGWAMCGKADMLGRLLGVDPNMRDGDIAKHCETPVEDICRHCLYGLPRQVVNERIRYPYARGELKEVVTKTWANAFERHRTKPVQLEKF